MKVPMKPGWYRNNVGERVVKSMQKESDTQKGVQMMVTEHVEVYNTNLTLDLVNLSVKEPYTVQRRTYKWF